MHGLHVPGADADADELLLRRARQEILDLGDQVPARVVAPARRLQDQARSLGLADALEIRIVAAEQHALGRMAQQGRALVASRREHARAGERRADARAGRLRELPVRGDQHAAIAGARSDHPIQRAVPRRRIRGVRDLAQRERELLEQRREVRHVEPARRARHGLEVRRSPRKQAFAPLRAERARAERIPEQIARSRLRQPAPLERFDHLVGRVLLSDQLEQPLLVGAPLRHRYRRRDDPRRATNARGAARSQALVDAHVVDAMSNPRAAAHFAVFHATPSTVAQ
ncbi:hypothetical protein A7982_13163 [Minicystis rosea]|nr:hypothetical protein A7982_13163 [Minicystis rosea]